jgi:hypothetical protein
MMETRSIQRRIRNSIFVLILVALALPRIGSAQGSGPEVTLSITSIKRTDSGFLVTGSITASGLNPEGQIVESDTVSIMADIQESPGAKYQELPDGMYIRDPEGAETSFTPGSGPGNTMTREECYGIDILSHRIAEFGLRETPVWRAYGGLGEWEKTAPSSVTSDFEGVIPLAHEGKTLRIRATLKHEWGGPYANWPAFSFHHDIGYEDVLKAMGDGPNPTPSQEPDTEDMCPETPGTTDLCGCSNTDVVPGDVIFRYAKPSWGSWYAGYAEVGGKKYNFGHVAVYAGNFQAKRTYQVRHANGVDVQRLNPNTQVLETIHLSQGNTIQANDIVNNAVIEADMGYGGVGISNLSNFESDHNGTAGSTAGGTMYGQPPAGLNCRQRKLILDRMAQFAANTDDGKFEYQILSNNCAQTVAQAYTEAGLNAWQPFVSATDTWTPNFVASWMLLSHFGEPRPGLNPSALSESKVSIIVKSPADLHVYDSSGRHTGATSNGNETNIPYTEYWVLENEHKVLNLLAQADDTYNIVVNGYAEGAVELEIAAYNFFTTEQAHDIHYQPVVLTSQTSAQISLDPNQLPEASKLTMAIDQNNDGQIDQYETPTITITEIDAGGWNVDSLPTLNFTADTLYLMGGGACLLLLMGVLLVGGIFLIARRRGRPESTMAPIRDQYHRVQDSQGRWWYQDPNTSTWSIWNGTAWQPAPGTAPNITVPKPPSAPPTYARGEKPGTSSCLFTIVSLVILGLLVVGGISLVAFDFCPGTHIQLGQGDLSDILKKGGGGLLVTTMGMFLLNGGFKAISTRRAVVTDEWGRRREKRGCSAILNGLGQLLFGVICLSGGLGLVTLAFYQEILPWLGF